MGIYCCEVPKRACSEPEHDGHTHETLITNQAYFYTLSVRLNGEYGTQSVVHDGPDGFTWFVQHLMKRQTYKFKRGEKLGAIVAWKPEQNEITYFVAIVIVACGWRPICAGGDKSILCHEAP